MSVFVHRLLVSVFVVGCTPSDPFVERPEEETGLPNPPVEQPEPVPDDTSPEDTGSPLDEVTLTVVDGEAPGDLPFVAFQDGDGPWQVLEGTDGVFTFSVTEERYGLMYYCDPAIRSQTIEVIYALTTELASRTVRCRSRGPFQVSGQIEPPFASRALLARPGNSRFIDEGQTTYEIDAPGGRIDLLLRTSETLVLKRDLDLQADAVVDLDTSLGFAPASDSFTGDVEGRRRSTLFTKSGVNVTLSSLLGIEHRFLPADQAAPGDMHLFQLQKESDGDVFEATYAFLERPRPITLPLPSRRTHAPIETRVEDGEFVVFSEPVLQADVQVHVMDGQLVPQEGGTFDLVVAATDGWLVGGGELRTPPMADVPGLPVSLGPKSEVRFMSYTALGVDGNYEGALIATDDFSPLVAVDSRLEGTIVTLSKGD